MKISFARTVNSVTTAVLSPIFKGLDKVTGGAMTKICSTLSLSRNFYRHRYVLSLKQFDDEEDYEFRLRQFAGEAQVLARIIVYNDNNLLSHPWNAHRRELNLQSIKIQGRDGQFANEVILCRDKISADVDEALNNSDERALAHSLPYLLLARYLLLDFDNIEPYIEIARKDRRLLNSCCQSIGHIYFYQQKYDAALDMFKRAYKLKMPNSVFDYCNTVHYIIDNKIPTKRDVANIEASLSSKMNDIYLSEVMAYLLHYNQDDVFEKLNFKEAKPTSSLFRKFAMMLIGGFVKLTFRRHRATETDRDVHEIISLFSVICSIVATFSLPFADCIALTSIQFWMCRMIARAYGKSLSNREIFKVLEQIGVTGCLGFAGQQAVVLSYKLIFPFHGWMTTVPTVYYTTNVIGKVMSCYFEDPEAFLNMPKDQIQKLINTTIEESKENLGTVKQNINDWRLKHGAKFTQLLECLGTFKDLTVDISKVGLKKLISAAKQLPEIFRRDKE